jgi:hypothetical protein
MGDNIEQAKTVRKTTVLDVTTATEEQDGLHYPEQVQLLHVHKSLLRIRERRLHSILYPMGPGEYPSRANPIPTTSSSQRSDAGKPHVCRFFKWIVYSDISYQPNLDEGIVEMRL